MRVLLIGLTFLLSFSALASIKPGNKRELGLYQKYLELKHRVLKTNLANIDRVGFVPQRVVLLKGHETIVAPMQSPHRKVFDPKHPRSNNKGIVMMPNLNRKELELQIQKVEAELKALN